MPSEVVSSKKVTFPVGGRPWGASVKTTARRDTFWSHSEGLGVDVRSVRDRAVITVWVTAFEGLPS